MRQFTASKLWLIGIRRRGLIWRIASWNIRTMCPLDDSHKTTIINKELARLNSDVAYLQETRLADSGLLMERDCTFFWQGLSPDEPRQYGIGFAVRNSLIASTETSTGGSSRIALRMKMSAGFVNIIPAYARLWPPPQKPRINSTRLCRKHHPQSQVPRAYIC